MSIVAFLVSALWCRAEPLVCYGAEKSPPAAGSKFTYSGALRPSGTTADNNSARSFRIHVVVTEVTPGGGCRVAWVLEEGTGNPRWNWSQRFGSITFNRALQPSNDRELPAIQGERDGSVRVIPLRLPLWSDSDRLAAGAQWDENDTRYEILGREEVAGRRCWRVGISNRLGPREVVWIDENDPVVTRQRELVFLGQGVSHELSLDLDNATVLSADELSGHAKAHSTLVSLRGPIKEKLSDLADSPAPATPAFLEQARTATADIQTALRSGAYVELAQEAVRETQSAINRQGNLAKFAEQVVGKPARSFALKTTGGGDVRLSDLKGKPVVLHFWDYRSEPRIAPYGETGYLDFVWRQRQKQGIAVVGIAVDSRLGDEETRSAARKDIRAFCDFMNLSYPVAFDEGKEKVIDLFGDPRSVGGKLPLYVVIAPDGRVAEYHTGQWSRSADEGLKDLDERLQELGR